MEVPEVRYAHRDGRAIAFQQFGGGDVDLLMVSEWAANCDAVFEHPGHLRMWRLHSTFARLIRADRSGIGSSDPAATEPAGIDDWAEDLAAVLDEAQIAACAVCAEGWGGHAAIALATTRPERVNALVLVNPFSHMPDGSADAAAEFVRGRWGSGRVLSGSNPGFGRDYLDFCARYERLAASPNAAAEMVRASFASDVRDRLSQVACPTLVIYTGDIRHLTEEQAREVHERIPDAEFLRIHGDTYSYYDVRGEEGKRFISFLSGEATEVWNDGELAVVAFTDIVASTEGVVALGEKAWIRLLDDVHDTVATAAAEFGGQVIKQTGDGHLLTFRSPGAAISALTRVRRAARALGVTLRCGVHMGNIQVRDDGDIGGLTVHVASRVMHQAMPDQIVVSRVVSDLLAGAGPVFTDLGFHELKGVPTPMQLFSVS